MPASSPLTRAVLVAGVALAVAPAAPAQTRTWTGATGNWSSPGSWVEGVPPTTTAESAVLNGAGTLTLDNSFSIGGLSLQSGTLDGPGTLTLSGAFDWSQGTIRGPGEIRANGGGTWPFQNGAGLVLDGRTLTLGGGTTTLTGSVGLNNGAQFNIAAGATLKLNPDGIISYWQGNTPNPGSVNNAGTLLVNLNASTNYTQPASIPFTNSGLFKLQGGAYGFEGGMVQTAGELALEGGSTHGFAPFDLRGGRLTGSGTIGGSARVLAGNLTIAPAFFGEIFISDGLTMSPGTVLELDLGPTNPEHLRMLGDLVLDGTLNVGAKPGFGPGTYTLIDYGGTLTDNGLTLGSAPAGYNYAIRIDAANTAVVLDVTPVPEPAGALPVAAVGIGLAARLARRVTSPGGRTSR